jgi:hypothetical protein
MSQNYNIAEFGQYLSVNVTSNSVTLNSVSTSLGTTFVANATQITVTGVPVSANGGVGNAGQVLTSNGATGSPYWANSSGGLSKAQTLALTMTLGF